MSTKHHARTGTVSSRFLNELGNEIVVSVERKAPDPDAVCVTCRWRGAHMTGCPAAPYWPQATVIRIEGPTSVSENYLTPMEASHLSIVLREALKESKLG